MPYKKNRAGLFVPDDDLIKPGVCNMFAATHLSGFGGGGEAPVEYATLDSGNNPGVNSLSGGDLVLTTSFANYGWTCATVGKSSGKWYFEMSIDQACKADPGYDLFGFVHSTDSGGTTTPLGNTANSFGYYAVDGKIRNNSTGTAFGSSVPAGLVMGCALDMDNGYAYWRRDGVWQDSGDPTSGASGTGAGASGLSGTYLPCASDYSGTGTGIYTFNFGASAFADAAPSGYTGVTV